MIPDKMARGFSRKLYCCLNVEGHSFKAGGVGFYVICTMMIDINDKNVYYVIYPILFHIML